MSTAACPPRLRRCAAIAVIVACISAGSVGGQAVVGLITDVRLVDTATGQDIEVSSSIAPRDFQPLHLNGCTFALSVPDIVPEPGIAEQFFSSGLIERLTLKPSLGGPAGVEICVKMAVPVRSQVALRASGLTIRLVRVADGTNTAQDGESFRPADVPAAASRGLAEDSGQSAIAGQAASPVAVSTDRRELELAMREARVARRELELEVGELRSQLAAQVSATATLDQQLAEREGFTDLLTPRIDRLADALSVSGSGLERPVERFDSALAVLEQRLADASSTGNEMRALQAAADALVQALDQEPVSLVVTNDDVNVRGEPSTSAVRIAFLPRGVLLHVVEENAGWSLVSAGDFGGWIFGELLTPMIGDNPVLGDSGSPLSDRAAQLQWARTRVAALSRELALTTRRLSNESERANELDAQRVRLAGSLAESQAQADQAASLDQERNALVSETEALGERARLAETEVADLRRRLQDAQALHRAQLAQLAAKRDAGVPDARDSQRGDADFPESASARVELVAGEGDRDSGVRQRLEGLASLATSDRATVQITAQTNLRRGPTLDQERLALLPIGFEMALLSQEEGWYEVVYGSLHGWVFGEFADVRAADATEDGVDSSARQVSLTELLDRVERGLAAARIAPPEFASGSAVVDVSDDMSPEAGDLLREAANALYARAAARRRGDVETYIDSHSDRFEAQQETREEWESVTRDRFLRAGRDLRIQNLSLRLVSQNLVAATYDEESNGESTLRKVDLGLEGGDWKVLLETPQALKSALE